MPARLRPAARCASKRPASRLARACSSSAFPDEHAADIAKQRANENSVLNGDTVVAGPLAGLTAGTAVFDSNGIQIGTVERIVPSRNGVVRNLLIRGVDGRIYPLAPATVSLEGARLIATTLMASANRGGGSN